MVTDRLTDTVYFSEWLRKDFPAVTGDICGRLDRHGVGYGFLRHTEDYWCRDYMPIQVSCDKYVQYVYEPDYLVKKGGKFMTDPTAALKDLNISTVRTDLIIDGGNVIRCPDKVIMTEKVFYENSRFSRNEVFAALEQLFECEPVFLPWDRAEKFGHADGVVRWVDGNTVLLTSYDESRSFAEAFRKELERHFDVIEMKYDMTPRNRKLSWAYINFLQTKDVILVPVFNIMEDEQAMEQIGNAFPDYAGRIEAVDMSEIIGLGGGLNCISWNIMSCNPVCRQ